MHADSTSCASGRVNVEMQTSSPVQLACVLKAGQETEVCTHGSPQRDRFNFMCKGLRCMCRCVYADVHNAMQTSRPV